MGIFSGIPILGGVIDKVGDKIIKGREVWKGNAENELQRGADGYASARNYVPQGWLAKQIRPFVTLTVLSTFIMLNVVICTLVFMSIRNFIETDSEDIGGLVKEITLIFSLLVAPGFLYYTFVGTIMTFWFGGQDGKYRRAHKETMAGVHTPAVARETSSNAPAGTRDGFVDVIGDDIKELSNLEKFQRRRRNRD